MSDNTPAAPASDPSARPEGQPHVDFPPAPPTAPAGAYPAAGTYSPPPAGAYPPPPQGGYGAPYGGTAAPGPYPGPAAYAGAPAYGYGAQPKTNVLAIVSLIASIVGFVGFLPIIGSIAGVITGHISLHQLKTTGENGRGMALAGMIIGYVGLALWIIGAIILFTFLAWAAGESARYGFDYSS